MFGTQHASQDTVLSILMACSASSSTAQAFAYNVYLASCTATKRDQLDRRTTFFDVCAHAGQIALVQFIRWITIRWLERSFASGRALLPSQSYIQHTSLTVQVCGMQQRAFQPSNSSSTKRSASSSSFRPAPAGCSRSSSGSKRLQQQHLLRSRDVRVRNTHRDLVSSGQAAAPYSVGSPGPTGDQGPPTKGNVWGGGTEAEAHQNHTTPTVATV